MIANMKFLFISFAFSVAALGQGSLTPPSGPAPSMKTLGQIEPRNAIEKLPFKISASGSYYLTTNLVVPTGLNGITVDANNVTLDLGGFSISGADSSNAGVSVVPGRSDISIRNGTIVSAGAGVEATSATHLRVDSLRVSKCVDVGISTGADSAVSNCQTSENGTDGIRVGASSTVANCQSAANGANGIEADQQSTVRDCTAARNAFSGVSVGDHSKVVGVSATGNSLVGINGGVAVHFTDCTANANGQHGINAGRSAFATHVDTSSNNQHGVMADDNATIIDSTASSNLGVGIIAGIAAHVTNCKVDTNGGGGIAVEKGSTVRDCSAQRNGNDGISVSDQCFVIRNNATSNANLKAAAGIHVRGTDNVIQENTATVNDRGISLDQGGNFVVKNTTTNNTLNFFTVGDQLMGPVVTTFDGGDPINPMSNFIY